MAPGVIITGGSSGIGLAPRPRFCAARPATRYFRRASDLLRRRLSSAAFINSSGRADRSRLLYSVGDTGDEATVTRQLSEATEFFGAAPKGLFLNAGIGGGRYPLEEFGVERFDQMFHVNVRGVFLWLRAALPLSEGQLSGLSNLRHFVSDGFATSRASCSVLRFQVCCQWPRPLTSRGAESGHGHIKCGLVCPAGVATPWWKSRSAASLRRTRRRPTSPNSDGGGGCGRVRRHARAACVCKCRECHARCRGLRRERILGGVCFSATYLSTKTLAPHDDRLDALPRQRPIHDAPSTADPPAQVHTLTL